MGAIFKVGDHVSLELRSRPRARDDPARRSPGPSPSRVAPGRWPRANAVAASSQQERGCEVRSHHGSDRIRAAASKCSRTVRSANCLRHCWTRQDSRSWVTTRFDHSTRPALLDTRHCIRTVVIWCPDPLRVRLHGEVADSGHNDDIDDRRGERRCLRLELCAAVKSAPGDAHQSAFHDVAERHISEPAPLEPASWSAAAPSSRLQRNRCVGRFNKLPIGTWADAQAVAVAATSNQNTMGRPTGASHSARWADSGAGRTTVSSMGGIFIQASLLAGRAID